MCRGLSNVMFVDIFLVDFFFIWCCYWHCTRFRKSWVHVGAGWQGSIIFPFNWDRLIIGSCWCWFQWSKNMLHAVKLRPHYGKGTFTICLASWGRGVINTDAKRFSSSASGWSAGNSNLTRQVSNLFQDLWNKFLFYFQKFLRRDHYQRV